MKRTSYQCQCADCQQPGDHPTKELHRQLNQFLARLDEQQQRWYVALEAKKIGHGGTKLMSKITGLHVNTIRRGRCELDSDFAPCPTGRIRAVGGGRKPVEKNSQR